MSKKVNRCPTCGQVTTYFIPNEDDEFTTIKAQLSAKKKEIAAMRTVIEAANSVRRSVVILRPLYSDRDAALEVLFRELDEYESKVTK